jgi:CubicO group peptidase (beta-lactamase class C family)
MTSTMTNNAKAASGIVLALVIGALGIYIADSATEPGGAVVAFLLMAYAVKLGLKAARNRLSAWPARTALAAGILLAALAALLTYDVSEPLFAQSQAVPSVTDSAPAPQYAAAVERARELVRTAILQQNLPGVSVAVGAGGTMVWAEGFGLRDVVTRTPVTPNTRFNIGTAASVVSGDVVARLGLAATGAEPAAVWSPEAVGEPGEDFPPFAAIRHGVLQPLGLAPPEYPLPNDRATFYVPRSDDDPRRGRRLMYMRDLACCAESLASYSTASDLVRVGLATGGSITGELAGGTVTSLVTDRDSGVVVAVLSNIAHANTPALAQQISEAFANQGR